MSWARRVPWWTWAWPLLGWAILIASTLLGNNSIILAAAAGTLIGCVFAAVYHAEVVAHRLGEPFGTLVLAVAVTVIEVALIVSIMIASTSGKPGLARDTVFAAVMITCNGSSVYACSSVVCVITSRVFRFRARALLWRFWLRLRR